MMTRSRKVLQAVIACAAVAAVSVALLATSVGAQTPDLSDYQKATYTSPTLPTEMADVGTRWIYEYSTAKNTDFAAMQPGSGDVLYTDGIVTIAADHAKVENLWNTLYFSPGIKDGASVNVVQTFVVPADGIAEIDPTTIVRHYGNEDTNSFSIDVAIFLNETKIWPTGTDWASVSPELTPKNKLDVEKISNLAVSKDDKLRFVIGCGKMDSVYWEDQTKWPVTIQMYTPVERVDLSEYEKTDYVSPTYENITAIGTAWVYETSTDSDTNFTDLPAATDTSDGALFRGEGGCAVFKYAEGIFLAPAEKDGKAVNAIQTFVAPADGYVCVKPSQIVRWFGRDVSNDNDEFDTAFAIYHNNTKIWPAGSNWQTVKQGDNNGLFDVPAFLDLAVKTGDRIRFVVNRGSTTFSTWEDGTIWNVTAEMYVKKAAPTTSSTADDSSSTTTADDGSSTTAASEGAASSTQATIPDLSGKTPTLYESPTLETLEKLSGRWIYEYSTDKNTDFKPMQKGDGTLIMWKDTMTKEDGTPLPDNEKAQLYNPFGNKLYMLPGAIGITTSVNIVQTFVVPDDGVLAVDSSMITRHYGGNDTNGFNIEVAVYLNDTLVWPGNDTWAVVGTDSEVKNTLNVPKIPEMLVSKGDKLRFVVGCGKMDSVFWEDQTEWPVTIRYYAADSEGSPETGDSAMPIAAAAVLLAVALPIVLTGSRRIHHK